MDDLIQLWAFIPGQEAAFCLDCVGIFNVRNRQCPKCGGEQFWLVSKWDKGIREKEERTAEPS